MLVHESRLRRSSWEGVDPARAPLHVGPVRCRCGTLPRTPVRPARRVVRVARSSAGSCSPPFLRPAGPVAAALGYAGLPGLVARALASREAAALGPWRRGERGPAGALLPRAVDARESTPQARVASGSPTCASPAGPAPVPGSPDLPASSDGRPSVEHPSGAASLVLLLSVGGVDRVSSEDAALPSGAATSAEG
jgi:hypothetical protein